MKSQPLSVTFGLGIATVLLLLSPLPSMAKKPVKENANTSTQKTETPPRYFKEANTSHELRKIRRVGVGAQALGGLGMAGGMLELNFTPVWSFTAGFGGGEGFQSFELQGKYMLGENWFAPYAALGFSNWKSTSRTGPIKKTKPAILGERLLNDDEKAEGFFQKNIIFPSMGLQFTQLKGAWAGTSVFAEINVLVDIGNFVAAPTGTLGMLYYF